MPWKMPYNSRKKLSFATLTWMPIVTKFIVVMVIIMWWNRLLWFLTKIIITWSFTAHDMTTQLIIVLTAWIL